MSREAEGGRREGNGEVPSKTSFSSSLLYVMGFMAALALLAWLLALALRHH